MLLNFYSREKKEVSNYCLELNVVLISFSVTTVRGSLSHSVSSVVFASQYGDVIMTVEEGGERGKLWFPAPSLSAHCVDSNPAGNLSRGERWGYPV